MKSKFIALITDFGTNDSFVSSMKGVIYSIYPQCRVIDITHQIKPQNIKMGAFYLMVTMKYMPRNTLFITVIDPDVGTGRGILWAKTKNYQFISPDNGLLSWVEENEKILQCRFINNSDLFLPNISSTFHGRDIMAPVAAYVAKGMSESKIGPIMKNYRKFPFPHPVRSANTLTGEVISIDHFGNVISNITREYITVNSIFNIGNKIINGVKLTYASVKDKEPLCLIGSFGFLEFSIRNGNFADTYGIKLGDRIEAIISLDNQKNEK